jgi:hypothetical protein
MAEVAAAGWPDREVIAVRHVRLLRGISLDGASMPLRVVAHPQAGSTETRSVVDVNIISETDPILVHYRAEIELGRMDDAPQFTPDPKVLEGAGGLPMDVEGAYRDWLFHGPIFRGITSIEAIGWKGARATLRASSIADCLGGDPSGEWLFDPIAIDSALQIQVIWTRLHWGVTLLPSGAREFRRFGSIRDGSRVLRHELRITSESQAPLSHADHSFHTSDGRLLATITDMEGTGSKALNRLTGGPGPGRYREHAQLVREES